MYVCMYVYLLLSRIIIGCSLWLQRRVKSTAKQTWSVAFRLSWPAGWEWQKGWEGRFVVCSYLCKLFNVAHIYRVWHKKVTPRFVGSFLSNGREFQCEILYSYLFITYLHEGINSFQLSNTVLKLLANVNSRSRSLYAIARPSVVCRLSVCLSVTFVHPT